MKRAVVSILLVMASTAVMAGDPFKGREVYQQHCASCHGADGRPTQLGVPDFTRGQGLLVGDLQLVETLRTGKNMMPAYQGLLSDQQLADAITYIRTLF